MLWFGWGQKVGKINLARLLWGRWSYDARQPNEGCKYINEGCKYSMSNPKIRMNQKLDFKRHSGMTDVNMAASENKTQTFKRWE